MSDLPQNLILYADAGGDLSHKEKEKKKYFLQVTSENVLQIHLQAFINMNDIGKHSHLHIYPPLRL